MSDRLHHSMGSEKVPPFTVKPIKHKYGAPLLKNKFEILQSKILEQINMALKEKSS